MPEPAEGIYLEVQSTTGYLFRKYVHLRPNRTIHQNRHWLINNYPQNPPRR
jgi:hypothetical protein